jgi:hypothetical protein
VALVPGTVDEMPLGFRGYLVKITIIAQAFDEVVAEPPIELNIRES